MLQTKCKEEIKMDQKSNLDLAYEYIVESKAAKQFSDIWNYICEKQGYSDDEKSLKIGKFYTNLSLDSRFVQLGDNMWDLRCNQTFDKVHIDINAIYSEDELTASDSENEDDDDDEDESIPTKEEEGEEADDSTEEVIK